jgi:peptidyl-lysine (3S)-dioxygenase / protease
MQEAARYSLFTESRELWVPPCVPRIPFHPSSIEFCSNFVARNSPVVLTGCPLPPWASECGDADHNCIPGLDGLIRAAGGGDQSITVNWTPSGLGDHVDASSGLFVKPHERTQTLQSLVDNLCGAELSREGVTSGVPYYSLQNDSLNRELRGLQDGLPNMAFASEAFGAEPDACNLWIGDDRSVTTCHKDHFDNLYLVCIGKKRFVLRPPCDVVHLKEQEVPVATYRPDAAGLLRPVVDVPSSTVSWISPEARADEDNNGALVVTVDAGEMLYLPSLWYHSVYNVGRNSSNRSPVVAVNFWYPMAFDSPLYVYYSFLKAYCQRP